MQFSITSIINAFRRGIRNPYTATFHRDNMRALLESAADAGASVELAFIKLDSNVRTMRCTPLPDTDLTQAYVTVIDLDKSAEVGHKAYRRVRLDTVISVTIRYNA